MANNDVQKNNILDVENLVVNFHTDDGVVEAVRDVSLNIPRNKTVALLGESGCGKSVTGLALLQLIDPPGRIEQGKVLFRKNPEDEPTDLAKLDPEGDKIRSIRGNEISMIFQEPRPSLTPVYTVGQQITEAIMLHQKLSKQDARRKAIELLGQVGIPAPEKRIDDYPHQLSGGMCQRAMVAMALSCDPSLLIADEPTTALDVTIQAAVLNLLKRLQYEFQMSILIITHDMGVVAEVADEVVVMYLGKVVERASVQDIFEHPRHPYTQGLFASIPRPTSDPNKPLHRIPGAVPDQKHMPKGCPFRGRCPEEMHVCKLSPSLQPVEESHEVSCWLYQDIDDVDEEELEAMEVEGT